MNNKCLESTGCEIVYSRCNSFKVYVEIFFNRTNSEKKYSVLHFTIVYSIHRLFKKMLTQQLQFFFKYENLRAFPCISIIIKWLQNDANIIKIRATWILSMVHNLALWQISVWSIQPFVISNRPIIPNAGTMGWMWQWSVSLLFQTWLDLCSMHNSIVLPLYDSQTST